MEQTQEKGSRPGGRSARVVDAVLTAAGEELSEVGIEHFSISAVARRAGVHETSIYRRWKTREALVGDVGSRRMQTLIDPPDRGSLRSDLAELVLVSHASLANHVGAALLVACLTAQPGTSLHDVVLMNWARRERYLEKLFVRAIERGEWDAARPWRPLTDMLLGAMLYRLVVTKEAVDPAYVEDLLDHALCLPELKAQGNLP